jgi:hypothetical protein
MTRSVFALTRKAILNLASISLGVMLTAAFGQAHAVEVGANIKPFRGKVIYQGTYSVNVEIPTPANQRNTLRFGGSQIPLGPSGRVENFKGSLTVELEFNGSAVSGTYKGTGVIDPGRMSGVVSGDQCELTESAQGNTSRTVAQCDMSVFNGTMVNIPGSRQKMELAFQAATTQVVDYDERDRKQAEGAVAAKAQSERATAKAKQDREAEAARSDALLNSLPPVNPRSKR